MFKFEFDLQDDLDDLDAFSASEGKTVDEKSNGKELPESAQTFGEISLDDLFGSLPSLISYSPLQALLSSGEHLTFARRDLFDARFQLISGSGEETRYGEEQAEDHATALQFLDAPSDLVPGVYEGGLKTWECSIDLAAYLDELKLTYNGKRILELGCGTAIPSLYILRSLFSSSQQSEAPSETNIHLQDYNRSVLELITFPNVLLAWYLSPASLSYRESAADPLPPVEPAQPNELPITPSLTEAFRTSLLLLNIKIRFFYGSWDSFDLSRANGKYDVVLTSETIYRTDSLGSLVQLLSDACAEDDSLAKMTEAKLSLAPSQNGSPTSLCLVAAKVLYFGVGGGVSDFIHAVEDPDIYSCRERKRRRGDVETVWEKTGGVGRKVLRVKWS
ncbi:hypothetical protein GLOTRDRAFT_44989 [Gloeophyllum trabeum ATCC 11539]|uniref:protein-histidine N-methyltransferase n=1 Tax=Gloeophyllum trabeum (strain ATCC 11539 / FP-39264 / Madison 617) TaxID=670483 RepID=S7Q2J2_GLOTA|nr:uncharacterized protein GLOTRDRAFT_44989 [Gloeophyllum trabeum ATCC 11539]EPQ53767.1 hypothetical protein GLOTRDRAFT_44989 [Gloeophyllum trabeum ATCC 11539]